MLIRHSRTSFSLSSARRLPSFSAAAYSRAQCSLNPRPDGRGFIDPRDSLLAALLHQHDELPVVALHLPRAGIANRKNQGVARPELVRSAVGLGEYELAAQHI